MRSQADALVDATHGSRWTGIVTYMLCASLLSGCANIVSVAASAKNSIGLPISIQEGILERQETTEPGSIRWSLDRRYAMDADVRVFPYPPAWGCSTEFIVNSADVIIGFNLVGDRCTFHKGELW